jgi:hypothetical protein
MVVICEPQVMEGYNRKEVGRQGRDQHEVGWRDGAARRISPPVGECLEELERMTCRSFWGSLFGKIKKAALGGLLGKRYDSKS